MTDERSDTTEAPRFSLRLPGSLYARLNEVRSGSLNAEIVRRLEESFNIEAPMVYLESPSETATQTVPMVFRAGSGEQVCENTLVARSQCLCPRCTRERAAARGAVTWKAPEYK